MKRYNPKEIEPKWQQKWEDDKVYEVDFDSDKPKYVGFGMFNYPSGAGIHVGHVRNFTIPDVVTRVKRQQGFESYQPVGWDSFGLPAENFAIKTGVSPQQSTKKAIEKYHEQYRAMGWGMDWAKEINTTDPDYYKWTQWCFVKLFENGLAYQKESAQWWCEHDKTVLADEQVESGNCWRCGNPVVKKNLKQWFFKIIEYADELLEATDDLTWTESVKSSQKSWIGRSVGAEVGFKIKNSGNLITVFTTRPDTLFGATFMVLAPEHPLVGKITTESQKSEVKSYQEATLQKSEVQRQQDADKEKTGVFTGGYAINPATNEQIPVWIADYVLMGYGTGAIMAVPAHDERDYDFAKKFDLEIKETFKRKGESPAFGGEGVVVNSGIYDGQQTEETREKIVADLEKQGLAREKVNYKMRDWLISRQRYWGAPIPIVHCEKDGAVVLPEDQLPLVLPEVDNYMPTGENTSALANAPEWVNTTCPKCGGEAKRETDTMDGYVCSSWYFLRYLDPFNTKKPFDEARVGKWAPIDFYNGGDHATAHLLYARFFNHFFKKIGLVQAHEPFKKMVFNGKIKASDGTAFSKSKGNGIDPLEVIEQGYGADSIRLYQMFAAPLELDVLWDEQGIPGAYRFISRVWTLVQMYLGSDEAEISEDVKKNILSPIHKSIKKVTEELEGLRFNTAIAGLMEAVNSLYKIKEVSGVNKNETWQFALEAVLQLLAPFAPHAAEELWHNLGNADTIHRDHWPSWDEAYLVSDVMKIVVQVNGKVRATIEVNSDFTKEAVIEAAKANEKVATYISGNPIKKSIYVPKKLVNFVI